MSTAVAIHSLATVLEYDSTRDAWESRYVDLLAKDTILPPACYVFLESGDWYKEDCSESDRRRILAPFHAPDFLGNKTCTDLNGYFGSRSSFAPDGNNEEKLASLSTWSRILTKKALTPEEGTTEKGKDYLWYEMGFFTYWENSSCCRVLCIGTPSEMTFKIKALLMGLRRPAFEPRDPLGLFPPLLNELVELFDDSIWRVTKLVRAVELTRWRKPDFEALHNLGRHTGHLVEVEQVAIETIGRIASLQESNFRDLPVQLSKTYQAQAKEYMAFQLQVMKSLKHRTQSTHSRLGEEITLAYNMLASSDNAIMKSVTLLTMIFLPATFISALFSTTFFSFDKDGWQFSPEFWIYWVVTIPLTVVVLIAWWWWLGGSYEVIRSRWLHERTNYIRR